LDATYDRLIRNELRYILDPKEVHGDDPSTGHRAGFPGETFRVLKEKEIRLYGEYHLAEGEGVGRVAPRQYPQNESRTKIGLTYSGDLPEVLKSALEMITSL